MVIPSLEIFVGSSTKSNPMFLMTTRIPEMGFLFCLCAKFVSWCGFLLPLVWAFL